MIYKRKEKLYNPIWQNSGHIKAVKEYLGDVLNSVPVHSIIVFGKQADLKFEQPFQSAKVIKSKQLLSVIERETGDNILNHFMRQKIKHRLSLLYVKDKKAQKVQSKKHIIDIKNKMNDRNSKVSNNVCPRCGSSLVKRKGKKGEFMGCRSFPKCRFIA